MKGRKSGEWRKTPVNPLDFDGERYWSRRAATRSGCGTCGSAAAGAWSSAAGTEEFGATEVADAEKAAVLRAYLEKWKWEVGAFFGGVGPDASDEELLRIAPDHPVFRISR